MSAHCPICHTPIEAFHVFDCAPTPEALAQAWIALNRPAAVDLSDELNQHQRTMIWPDPEKLPEGDPVRDVSGVNIASTHNTPGYWMRPAAVEYVQPVCSMCGKPFETALPVGILPEGTLLTCPSCAPHEPEVITSAPEPNNL